MTRGAMDNHPTNAELWVDGRDERKMCALLAGGNAVLFYMGTDGDSDLVSNNPHYTGPKDTVVKYTLTNGQIDEYPLAWAVSRETALRALAYFSETAELPSFVHWAEG